MGFSVPRKLKDDEKGSALTVTAIFLPAIIGLSALVVDVGGLMSVKTGIENVAIAASEAASLKLPDVSETEAFAEMIVREQILHIPRLSNVTTEIHAAGGSVSVLISGEAATVFGQIFDLDKITVSRIWSATP